jgi:hypothetical protein
VTSEAAPRSGVPPPIPWAKSSSRSVSQPPAPASPPAAPSPSELSAANGIQPAPARTAPLPVGSARQATAARMRFRLAKPWSPHRTHRATVAGGGSTFFGAARLLRAVDRGASDDDVETAQRGGAEQRGVAPYAGHYAPAPTAASTRSTAPRRLVLFSGRRSPSATSASRWRRPTRSPARRRRPSPRRTARSGG